MSGGKTASSSSYDLIIIGGGPVGLAFAASLRSTGLRICLLEKQSEAALANPFFDGRDIALTHGSIRILDDLGITAHLPKQSFAPIRQAHVLNGISPYALNFDSRDDDKDALGYLVSNHLVRKAAYQAVQKQSGLELRTGVEVTGIETGEASNIAHLGQGKKISAPLVIAADSRFSTCRRLMGIPVSMRDFGRTVVVCRLSHAKAHDQIAYECFHYGQTLAILPLKGNVSSAVITLPSDKVAELMAMSAKDFATEIAKRFDHRLGAMTLITERHAYPLVATYADRFNGHRFALLGDAAVGMHPVTAHGYNFGLYGARTLAESIKKSVSLGLDLGDAAMLGRFSAEHRKATLPLYMGTNTLVSLFTDERPVAKKARSLMLHLGNIARPIKGLITRQLTQIDPTEARKSA